MITWKRNLLCIRKWKELLFYKWMKTKQYKINYTGVLYLYISEISLNAVIITLFKKILKHVYYISLKEKLILIDNTKNLEYIKVYIYLN